MLYWVHQLGCPLCNPPHLPWPVLPPPALSTTTAAASPHYLKKLSLNWGHRAHFFQGRRNPSLPDSPIAESRRKCETPRSLPGPGLLSLHSSLPHRHTLAPHTSPISLRHDLGPTLCSSFPQESQAEKRERTFSLQNLHGAWLNNSSFLAQSLVGSMTRESYIISKTILITGNSNSSLGTFCSHSPYPTRLESCFHSLHHLLSP